MGRIFRRWKYILFSVILAGMVLLVTFLLRRQRAGRARPTLPARPVPVSLLAQITGLSDAEAAARQIPFDREAQQEAEWRRFRRDIARRHLLTFFNLDMVGAAIAMYLLGSAWSAILSLLVLVLSFGLNIFQEVYTKRQLDQITEKLQPQATVIRAGRVRTIPLETLVGGDMVVVGVGDRIMAGGEIVGHGQIQVNESVDATGGVVRQVKQAGDRISAGSICVSGQAVYRVTEVERLKGVLTGGIKASLLPETPTPLQQLIERIFKILFVLVLVFNALLFLNLGAVWLNLAIFDGVLIRDLVSQIFAIAPTSLFLMIAVSYAVGLLRIADVGALVYRSETIESLANVSVICFSSSGTLTGQQASLEKIAAPLGCDQLSESRIRQILGDCLHSTPAGQPVRRALARSFSGQARLFKEMAPFYNAFGWGGLSFELDDLRGTYILGDAALLQPCLVPARPDDAGDREEEDQGRSIQPGRWNRLLRVWRFKSSTEPTPAESLDGPQTVVSGDSKPVALDVPIQGHGPVLIENSNGSAAAEVSLTFKQQWRERFHRWFTPVSVEPETEVTTKPGEEADGTNLLFAYRPEAVPLYDEAGFPQLPPELIPLGRIQLTERVRPEAVEVVQAFVRAGVKIKILSADMPSSLGNTVTQLGLQESPRVMTGAELHHLDAATFARTIRSENFMAQLTPAQQADIVIGLRVQGDYVAMVGNDVSDIPAFQQANLRIASQVDSQAALTLADIVLLDRSLQVLPNVLYRGQQIVNGLLDTFKLYLTHVAAQLLMIVIVIWLLAMPAPYSSTQASIVSFFAITVPAIFLPFWSSVGRVTRQSMIGQLRHFVLPAALTTMVLAVSLYAWYVRITADLVYARLVVTHALVAAGLVRVIFVKPPTPFWVGGNSLSGDWRPVWMTVGAAAIYIAFVAITAAVPTFQSWFDLDALRRPQDYLVIALAVMLWAIVTRTLWRTFGWLIDRPGSTKVGSCPTPDEAQ